MGQQALKGKLYIQAQLTVLTGLHIGAGSDFAPIGAVDSPFIRDPFTKQPIIPGSSVKGKIRTVLAKSLSPSYVLQKIEEDDERIQRLFGSAAKDGARPARLQFFDMKMTADSVRQFDAMELDTYIGEVKFENSIDRLTATANPRQIERVPADAAFQFQLVYNVESPEELIEDMQLLADGFKLLQMDYLGGHGSRGYGRVRLSDFHVGVFSLQKEELGVDTAQFEQLFEGCNIL